MAASDLQNSYGPEIAPNGHDLPQAIAVGDGLEAVHTGQQYSSTTAPLAPPYSEQHVKNNQYASSSSDPTEPGHTGRKKRVLGLPIVVFWGILIGLVLILAVGLGVGLGVGLSQRDSSGESAATTAATSSASSTPTSSTASSSTSTSATTSASSPLATARNVEICNQASLASDCTTLNVPVNTCVDFPSAYNNSVSSVDTGGPECVFYTGETCSGQTWSTNGTRYVIPGQYNDAFSSVACFFR